MKSIKITGTNNRYQMKKVTRENGLYKYKSRVLTNGWDPSLYEIETQLNLLSIIKNLISEMGSTSGPLVLCNSTQRLMKTEIENKLSGYHFQDSVKKREGVNISFSQTIDKMIETQLFCYYCNTRCNVFYERVREMTQWSFDRIDNSLCHSVDNVVLSCLKCNLERKTRNSKKFKDTKDMKEVVLLGAEEAMEAKEEESTEISEPFIDVPEITPPPPPTLPKTSTRVSKRLVEKLANNVVVNDSVVVSIQEEIH
jgi:hypothetical protein